MGLMLLLMEPYLKLDTNLILEPESVVVPLAVLIAGTAAVRLVLEGATVRLFYKEGIKLLEIQK